MALGGLGRVLGVTRGDGLYRATRPGFACGLVIQTGRVERAAPYLIWWARRRQIALTPAALAANGWTVEYLGA